MRHSTSRRKAQFYNHDEKATLCWDGDKVDNFLRPSMRRFVRHGPECLGGSVMSQALTSADIAQQTSGSRSSPDVRPGAGPLLSPLYHRIIRCVDTSLPVWARTPLMCWHCMQELISARTLLVCLQCVPEHLQYNQHNVLVVCGGLL